ncbi:Hpt domain-containing protein [Arabiibacter massiliensis]|uniref:Hpt domain-containing protein n=1 Tax=Arabiibacter massiliensis TaxID=1870985 RepID=UPI0009B978EA|nr:Hpt domain-containing protein [Arabiibacter massiliensis]
MAAEHIDTTTSRVIDYDEAMERFCGNRALYERLALKFLDDPHFEALENALAEGHLDEAHRAAHSLKGVSGNLSFYDLFQAACVISDSLRDGDAATAKEAMPRAREAYAAVMEAVKGLRG